LSYLKDFWVLGSIKFTVYKIIQHNFKVILIHPFTSKTLPNPYPLLSRVDFTNVFARVFCTRFSYKRLFSSYVLVTSKKSARKMREKTLVKSTPEFLLSTLTLSHFHNLSLDLTYSTPLLRYLDMMWSLNLSERDLMCELEHWQKNGAELN